MRKRHTPHEFDAARRRGDWARNKASTPKTPHVVFVSTGLGEMRITEQLDAELKRLRPDISTTWAVRRRETIETIAREHPHQPVAFMPFDFCVSVNNWLKNVRPDVVVLVEKLWTPNLIWCSRNAGAKVLVCNGVTGAYLSETLSGLNRWTLAGLDAICLQTQDEKEKLESSLPVSGDIRICGALKLSTPPKIGDDEGIESLRQWVGDSDRPIFAAGSTHEGEEEFVLRAFRTVRDKYDSRLLLAPRRPHRAPQVLSLCEEFSLSVNQRSLSRTISADVYLLDTVGELNSAYGLAEAAFVGGTLKGPGHNVLEPVAFGIPVSYGPGADAKTKPPAQTACEANGVGFVVSTSEELAQQWLRVLEDHDFRETIRQKSTILFDEQRCALECNVAAIISLSG